MDILNLKDAPQHLPRLASWHHAEWSHLNPKGSLESRIEKMSSYLSNEPIPTTFICINNNQLVGSAAVIEHDMDTHKELSPWLASVFVKPELRNQGFGSELVHHVMQYIGQLKIYDIYLFTEDKKDFYSSLGWFPLSEEAYRKVQVTIMKTTLNTLQSPRGPGWTDPAGAKPSPPHRHSVLTEALTSRKRGPTAASSHAPQQSCSAVQAAAPGVPKPSPIHHISIHSCLKRSSG